MEAFKELLKSMGIENRRGITKMYIKRRISENKAKGYDEIFIDNK
jgi:hypothetical protein